jgi:integrase
MLAYYLSECVTNALTNWWRQNYCVLANAERRWIAHETSRRKSDHASRLRHLFATRCIESGVDMPTVSRWFGHKDGGALAMKTYGHLLREHSIAQRAECQFRAYTNTAG